MSVYIHDALGHPLLERLNPCEYFGEFLFIIQHYMISILIRACSNYKKRINIIHITRIDPMSKFCFEIINCWIRYAAVNSHESNNPIAVPFHVFAEFLSSLWWSSKFKKLIIGQREWMLYLKITLYYSYYYYFFLAGYAQLQMEGN